MGSRFAGSVVSLYRRWSARSSSRDGRGLAANRSSLGRSGCQVLDHPEADVSRSRFDLRPEVVDEASDHLVGEPLELGFGFRIRPGHGGFQVTLLSGETDAPDQAAMGPEGVHL